MPVKPHAFVAMPFGSKPGADGKLVDFNRVYEEYIVHAVQAAGLEVFRADEEMSAGDIRTDMFQELLMADLVVADITIDNPNVWYELGVRHALRARGVVLVSGGRVPTAFDLYTDRKLRYDLKEGAPDPDMLEANRDALTKMIKATMESWHGDKISPVYNLLPNLEEPDWTRLRVGKVLEFWEAHDQWEDRIELAGKAHNVGDILVLADEAPVTAFRAQAWIKAGKILREAGRYDFALEQLERGLAVRPKDLTGLREKGICLQRLGVAKLPGHSIDKARTYYDNALKLHPCDSELWAQLGRVDKDQWTQAWRVPGKSVAEMRDEATYEEALLRAAIDSYAKAFRADVSHYFSGINALTLMHLHRHLTGEKRYDDDIAIMGGAVRFAAMGADGPQRSFWAAATLADLEMLSGTPESTASAYREAVSINTMTRFQRDSCCAQLLMLRDLDFRQESVSAGIGVLERAKKKFNSPDECWQPDKVLLFSGHIMDAPNRAVPRFPADKEAAAAQRLQATLDRVGLGANDLAICQAAAGGDLLFLEACRQRGARCLVLLPFPKPEFIEQSIRPSAKADAWRDRFFAIVEDAKTSLRIMPNELGPTPAHVNAFERCNLWLLYSALAYGEEKLHFVCLWNGAGGDGPGGTAHMYNEVNRRTGRVHWINTKDL